MAEEKGFKVGLNEEDVKHRDEGPGIAGLLQAMGDENADAAAIAASEDGQLIAQLMSVMVWEHISKFARDTETGKLIRL